MAAGWTSTAMETKNSVKNTGCKTDGSYLGVLSTCPVAAGLISFAEETRDLVKNTGCTTAGLCGRTRRFLGMVDLYTASERAASHISDE
jgi:hypothetical protein